LAGHAACMRRREMQNKQISGRPLVWVGIMTRALLKWIVME